MMADVMYCPFVSVIETKKSGGDPQKAEYFRIHALPAYGGAVGATIGGVRAGATRPKRIALQRRKVRNRLPRNVSCSPKTC